MEILYLMILCSVSLGLIFLLIFLYGAKKGQFEDDESPAIRMLFDSEVKAKKGEEQDLKEEKNLNKSD